MLLAVPTGWAGAAVPLEINYQGRLTDAASQPVNATVPMVFKLYSVASGGSALYSEAQSVTVSNGIFSVAIGSVTPLALPFDVPYYIGVSVGADPEMTPRQALQSSPYALRSAGVDSTAALPAVQITGTLGTAQIANNAVTQAKLSPVSGAAAGKVLGTDGANLQWQSVGVGTVTSVATGSGLTGGPITSSGTINLAATQLLPAVACTANQVPKWNGSAWACAADANSGGTVTSVATGTGLTGGPITASGTINLAATQLLPTVACAANQVPKWNGSAWTCAADNAGPANAYVQGGNAFGALPGGIAVLGTTDANDLNLVINNNPVMRFQQGGGTSPNIIGGHANNGVVAFFSGQTIGGGGDAGNDCYNAITLTNTRTCGNVVNGDFAIVGGGYANTAGGFASTVAGGVSNISNSNWSTVAGGYGNVASAPWSAVMGGDSNSASAYASTVLGGWHNNASGIGSVAAGDSANANQDSCFVFGGWSNFPSAGPNCLGQKNIVRFMVDHGFSVDYSSARADGGGNRWVAIGDTIAGDTIHAWNHAHLTDAGVWVDASSSVHTKTEFEAVDAGAVLREVVRMPITTWRYKEGEGGVRHIGPMAEDFWAAFGVGYGPQTIANLDARGVALAAIQGLNAKLEEQVAALQRNLGNKDAKIAAQSAEIAALRKQATDVAALKLQVAELVHLARLQQWGAPVVALDAPPAAR
ncbi:MAG TPA: hypothetical protein PLW68_14375 [Casimicrobiaceae bacterium]|nr:hypothetical protein [Casimicrobiaceae bacterium]